VIVNRPVIIQGNSDFAKKSDVRGSTSIPSAVNFIRTAGYTLQGDSGGALYKRAGSTEPSHGGKIQDANNIWWEIAERPVHVKMFGAIGDGTTDDTAAIQLALDYGLATGCDVRFSGTYRVTDTLNIDGGASSEQFRMLGENGESTQIIFDNAVSLKNLFHIGGETNYLRIERLQFLDGTAFNARVSRCFYFTDTSATAVAPSWKHKFEDVRIFGFAEGARFDGGATVGLDTHLSEVMFLHSKFRNCAKGLIYNNIQAVNHQLIGVDFENDHADDVAGKWPHIVFERGSTVNHVGGSVIGYGPYIQFEYSAAAYFQQTSQFVSRGVRLEGRGDGPFIVQDTDSSVTLSNFFRLHFDDMPIVMSDQTSPVLARFGGRVYAKFDNCHANDEMTVEAYMTSNLASNLQYGFIEINDCVNIIYDRVSDVAAYGGTAVAATNIQSIPAQISRKFESTLGATVSSYYELETAEATVYAGAFQQSCPKTFVIAKSSTAGLGSGSDPATIQFRLPLYARPYKFRLLRDDVNAGSAFVLTLYAVVSAVDYQVATITPTAATGGHFEADLQTATGLTYWLRDDVDWDGKMKVVKSGTSNGFVGLIMVDYM
jgi:hypothetical protein